MQRVPRHAVFIFSLAGALVALPQPAVGDEESTEQDLRARVAELEQTVQRLQAQTGDNWLTEERAAEIRSIVQDVLADADTRASLLQGGMTAGHDGKFFLAAPDGSFRLNIDGQVQVRYVFNHRDEPASPSPDFDSTRHGFEMRRAKIIFTGHVIDPTWTFDIQGAFNRSGGDFELEDAGWLRKDLGGGWKITVGQMKAPFMREELGSSKRLVTVERSLVNDEFSAKTVQGVQLSYDADAWRAAIMYHDGSVNGVNSGSANTEWSLEDTEYAFSGRVEWAPLGDMGQFSDYEGWKDDETGLLLGAAFNYQKEEYGTSATDGEIENFGFTADAGLELSGAHVFGAIVYRQLDSDLFTDELSQFGIVIEGGLFVTDDWQIFARYEWADFDLSSVEDLNVVTIGATHFWKRHSLKWTTDIGIGLDEINGVWASDGAGWLEDEGGEDGQVVIRSQLQLLF